MIKDDLFFYYKKSTDDTLYFELCIFNNMKSHFPELLEGTVLVTYHKIYLNKQYDFEDRDIISLEDYMEIIYVDIFSGISKNNNYQ